MILAENLRLKFHGHGHENMTMQVRFLIKIPFVCLNSMHKIHFRFRINKMYHQFRKSQTINW